jgi:hemoglobin
LPGLRPDDFDVWLDLFRSVAAECCPPGAAATFVDKAERIAASMMLMMSTERGSDWLPPARLRVMLGRD